MKTVLQSISAGASEADLILIPVAAAERKPKTRSSVLEKFSPTSREELKRIDRDFNGLVLRKLKSLHSSWEPCSRVEFTLPHPGGKRAITFRLCVIGNGQKSLDDWRKLGGDAYNSAKRLQAAAAAVELGGKAGPEIVQAVCEGTRLASYMYLRYKGKTLNGKRSEVPRRLILCVKRISAPLRKAVSEAGAAAEAACFSRDLVNTPPSALVPADLVSAARRVARSSKRISLRVMDERALRRMRADALLAVGRGSPDRPYMVHLKLRGKKGGKKIVLIGKGITFDSGGLCLKPGKSMEDMKCDMAGAACVLGVMHALAALPQLRDEVHVIVPAAENLLSGSPVKPGDVVRAMNGKTIEILNTDAEGRLILADALSYSARIQPDVVIDVATLTGACVAALGSEYAGMFSNEAGLAEKLKKASAESGEKIWELPLAKEYRPLLNSQIAKLQNISQGGGPGAITAALFLKEFVPSGCSWAHLDIAGPAFTSKQNDYITPGGTGFGVRLLLRFLQA